MKEIEKIASNIEEKLARLEDDRNRVAEQIQAKKQRINQLEVAIEKLRNVQKQFGG